ncbi:MAG: hypothetical protein KTR31_10240 [Myxococcales bacterium]|nr:hypothetical protein [Myxococcales bacterium]
MVVSWWLACARAPLPAPEPPPTVIVDPNDRHQIMWGFGASLTESSAEVWRTLPEATQRALVEEAFDPVEGLGFSVARTHIGSTDFSLGHYAYVPDGATDLTGFSLEREAEHLRPLLRSVQAVAGDDYRLIASPWSPPAWLKDNGAWIGGSLLREHDGLYADYLSRYLTEQARIGVEIHAITPQNEPLHGGNWDTCVWTAEHQRDFLRDHLGPALERDGHGEVQVLVFDHNRADVRAWVDVVLADPEAARHVDGVAVHWYAIHFGGGTDYRHDVLAELSEAYPDLVLVHTESSLDLDAADPVGQFFRTGPWDWTKTPFEPFDQYARDLIGTVRAGAVGYVEWNWLLDTTGGPNPYDNFNSAPFLVDRESGSVIRTPLLGLLGQFSAHVRPGAVRVGVSHPEDLPATGFVHGDDTVVVVYNPSPEERRVSIDLGQGQTQVTTVSARSVQTLVRAPGGVEIWETGPSRNHEPLR